MTELFKAILIVGIFVVIQIIFIMAKAWLHNCKKRHEQKMSIQNEKSALREDLVNLLTVLLFRLRNEEIFWIEIYNKSKPEDRLFIQKIQDANTEGFKISGFRAQLELFDDLQSNLSDSENNAVQCKTEPDKCAALLIQYVEKFQSGNFPELIKLRY